ncbi:alpha/beta-hydrolase [Daldinia caldariorum]|uniref:alpha/beta-hydrolase n=1 Tax=Daldinia caldariorum TaxID=326644 RepID=UPI002007C24A|nr:alpha/beta-hydrolase [Daldinia caldariorum]KAI1464494.1 alpha/beta-hydrolase [Daldinia caldariorum]
MASSLDYTVHRYGAHELQRVGVWDLDIADKTETKYWIIYIHGGAWRDPRIAHETFAPVITRFLEGNSDESPRSGSGRGSNLPVAAFASLDYRLSPHPEFPQDPATTPPERFRGARHPEHLADVRAALAFLQRRYAFGRRYVLVGHSAGACLAYQLVAGMSSSTTTITTSTSTTGVKEDDLVAVELPAAVFGVEGIYDMQGLDARFGGGYAGFLEGAFGPRGAWDGAAPMRYAGSYKERFAGGLAVLGHSVDDELVDMPETVGMAERLEKDGVEVLLVKDLRGLHDDAWRDGRGVARTVLRTLEILRERDGA